MSFLIHLAPTCLTFSARTMVELVDLRIGAFGLLLKGGTDLVVRRPMPNPRYAVACARKGTGVKAYNGILIEAERPVSSFVMEARWSVGAEYMATHKVEYQVLDHEFDATTEDMVLWSQMSPGLGNWPSRWPKGVPVEPPVNRQPKLHLLPPARDLPETVFKVEPMTGRTVHCHQVFRMPSVERDRLFSCPVELKRRPRPEHAFPERPIPTTLVLAAEDAPQMP